MSRALPSGDAQALALDYHGFLTVVEDILFSTLRFHPTDQFILVLYFPLVHGLATVKRQGEFLSAPQTI